MKHRGWMILLGIQILISLLGIGAFVILMIYHEDMSKWYLALILSIVLLFSGVVGMIHEYRR